MRNLLVKTIGLGFLFAICSSNNADAQSNRKIKAAYRSTPPTAVFVELFTYQNKIDRLIKSKQVSNAETLKKDAAAIIANTVADFNANFNFCPVYYFYDTNADMVLKHKFEGVLLDKNLNPVNTSPVSNADTSYLIINYGPAAISRKEYEAAERGAKNNLDFGVGNNVMINTYKMNFLNYEFNPLPNFVLYDKKLFLRVNDPAFSYTSKKFNMSYKGLARYFNEKINKFYRP